MKQVKDSSGRTYNQTESGTCYSPGTPEKLVNVLERLLDNRNTRIRIWYGENGKSWNEENHLTGYLGRSTGPFKIPLLINNSNSIGGGGLLDNCIVKIVNTRTKQVLYQHENFSQSVFTVHTPSDLPRYTANVLENGNIYGRCKTVKSAQRLADFMNGKRMSK